MDLPANLPPPKLKPVGIFRPQILIGVAAGLFFEIAGYYFLRGDQTAYGLAMFIAVPLVMGFAIGIFSETRWQAFWGIVITLLLGIGFLILVKWEGWICCVLASPILFFWTALGTVVGYEVRCWLLRRRIKTIIKFFLLGVAMLSLMGAKAIEQPHLGPRLEIINSSVLVPAKPERAWDLIKSIERVDTHKPLMLAIGLPVPQSCTLDKEGVGGKRTCYFDLGIITQEITEWNPPHFMKVKITGSTLPGRHWLTFVNAGYEFIPQGDQTLVIRTTTISSRLYPRWYWRQFEEYGVQSEHEYVLADLVRRAKLEMK